MVKYQISKFVLQVSKVSQVSWSDLNHDQIFDIDLDSEWTFFEWILTKLKLLRFFICFRKIKNDS